MSSLLISSVVMVVLQGFLYEQASAQCCGSIPALGNTFPFAVVFRCNDGTDATPYCGHGPCNIFGCACQGGCRGRRRRDIDDQVEKVIKDIDSDLDGRVSLAEAVKQKAPRFARVFNEIQALDTNKDGFLDASEIDNNK